MQGCRHEAVIPGVALLSSHHWHQLEQVPRRGDAHDPLLMSPYNGESSLARRLILIRVTQSSGDHSTFLCRAYPSWIGSGVSCFTSSVCLHHSGVLPHLMNLNVLFPSDSMMYLPRSATLVENHSELTTTSNHVLPLPSVATAASTTTTATVPCSAVEVSCVDGPVYEAETLLVVGSRAWQP